MQFVHNTILWFLWLVPVLYILLWLRDRRHQRLIRRVIDDALVPTVISQVRSRQRFWRRVLLCGVTVFSILALARPQWGFEWREVRQEAVDILLAIDTSRSMLTADVRPNRLERTKLAVRDLVEDLQGDRIGLIGFAGRGFLFCPLTIDYAGFLLSLEDLSTRSIPRGGTNIAQAIEVAIDEYAQDPGKDQMLVILTDGENLEGDPMAMARKARDKGITIYTIGIGTQEGELIWVEDETGKRELLKDDKGNVVKSRLNEDLLQDIALTTGGAYVRASGAQFGLELLYRQELVKHDRREIESQMQKRYYERFQIPLVIAIALLAVETILPRRRKER